MPDAGKGPSFRFSSFSQCVSSGWKRGDGKQLIKEQGTLPYRGRPFCCGLSSGAPDGGLQAFPYGGWDVSGGGVSSVDRYIGERIEARGLRADRSRGASAVGHGGRMPSPAWRNQEGSPSGPLWRHFPGESARGVGPLRAGVSGPFSPPRCREGTDSAAGRDTSFPPQGSLVQASKARLSNQKSRACGSLQLPAGRPALRQRCSRYCPRSQPCSTGTCGRKTP